MSFSRNINFFSCYVSKKIPRTLRLQTFIPLDTNPGRQRLTRMKKIISGRSRTVVRFDILLTLRCTKLHSRHDKTLIMSRYCSCTQHAHISQLGQSVMLYIPEDTERVSEANIKSWWMKFSISGQKTCWCREVVVFLYLCFDSCLRRRFGDSDQSDTQINAPVLFYIYTLQFCQIKRVTCLAEP